MKRFFLIVLFVVLASHKAIALPRWTTFTTRDGSASNWVSSIFEDTQGNLWFGATRYDGLTWTKFQVTDNFVISETSVGTIWEDDEGQKWVHVGNDVVEYDPSMWQPFDRPNQPIFDTKGNIWLEKDGRLKSYQGGTWIDIPIPEEMKKAITTVLKDRKGNIWIGSGPKGGPLYRYDPIGNRISFTEQDGLTDDHINEIFEDSHGNIWIATQDGGVNRYDGKTWSGFTTSEGLVDEFVMAIWEDSRGNMWFGTSRGVSQYRHGIWTTFTKDDGLADNSVSTIYKDRMGNLWFGTNGGGVSRYDVTTHLVSQPLKMRRDE